MIKLQYYNGENWETISEWESALAAWISLGGDTINYRTIDYEGSLIAGGKTIYPTIEEARQ